jgi:hypothetical protein
MSTVIHIEIYLLNPNSKSERDNYTAFYNVDDNDENILFSPVMFPECIIIIIIYFTTNIFTSILHTYTYMTLMTVSYFLLHLASWLI